MLLDTTFLYTPTEHYTYSVNLEGEQTPIPFSTLINRPDLRHVGSNLR